ncbi:ferrous iron transport protein A [Halalkaliarchaeum desulfuricum]|uniref:Ferrous iron transport protein A n=1 Tax=Halalkaliarchaeum desulfuricum TaxID=2055893 RepID=A0A343TI93_9EURY|nr:nicotianamine synthase family protein [Halalkaliarchaeum desulfuricum]AUX08815.1 ferrous iron transport protein A [Halalkaliarchaeum desulfuricum]
MTNTDGYLRRDGSEYEGVKGSRAVAASAGVLKRLERLDRVSSAFGNLYRRLFYEHVIERELGLVAPDDDASVLQVGCGPLPMTAMALAERGYDVVAIDNDPDAVDAARRAVESRDLTGRIDFAVSDGQTLDTASFDVIWMAFHVHPKREVVVETMSQLRAGQTLVYRRPRGWASPLFPNIDVPSGDVSSETIAQRFGKESVVVCNDPTDCAGCSDATDCPASQPIADTEAPPAATADGGTVAHGGSAGGSAAIPTGPEGPTLESLEQGERAVVSGVPDHDLLSPLGVRPGNSVRVRGRQLFGGPLIVEAEGRRVAIDRSLADHIRVTREDPAEDSQPNLDVSP